jgi:hypothetical protein
LHGTLAKHAETTLIRSRMSVIFYDRLPALQMKKVLLSTRARSKSSESHNWRKCRQIGPDSGGSQICFWQTGRRSTGKCSTHKEDLSHRGLTRSLHTKEYLSHRKSHQKSHKRSLSHRAARVCNKKTSKK